MSKEKFDGYFVKTTNKPGDIREMYPPLNMREWVDHIASIMPDGYSITVSHDWRLWVFIDNETNPDPDLYCHVQPWSNKGTIHEFLDGFGNGEFWYEDTCGPAENADIDYQKVCVWLAGHEASDNDEMLIQEIDTSDYTFGSCVENYRITLLMLCGFISGLLNVCHIPEQTRREIVSDDLRDY
jgi:hypothetical protein|tara:strand:+ start:901 stop:1449 length:549 start_codon:yes stop_codon:yes gene_type:complete